MALLFIHDGSNDTLAQYDEVVRQLEAAGHGQPPGRLSHVAARKGNGYIVTDVWESQEALDRFAQTVMPLLQQVGAAPPQTHIYTVHNIIKGA